MWVSLILYFIINTGDSSLPHPKTELLNKIKQFNKVVCCMLDRMVMLP